MAHNKIYEPELTFIFVGDTNAAKTTTFNTLLRNITGIASDFYCVSGADKTKATTVFQLNSDEFMLEYNGQTWKTDSFQELQTQYNAMSSGNATIDLQNICRVYVRCKFSNGQRVNIVDTIGRSSKVDSNGHDSMIASVKRQFPNHVIINMSRTPKYELLKAGNEVSILTHADTFDYKTDPVLEVQHADFLPYIGKSLFVYTNNLSSGKLLIHGTEVRMYGNDHCHSMFDAIFECYKAKMQRVTVKSIQELSSDDVIKNATSISQIVKQLYIYNDKDLLSIVNTKIAAERMCPLDILTKQYQKVVAAREDQQAAGNGLIRLTQIMEHHVDNNDVCESLRRFVKDQCNLHRKSNRTGKDFTSFDVECTRQITILSNKFVKVLQTCIFDYAKTKAFVNLTQLVSTSVETSVEHKKRKIDDV